MWRPPCAARRPSTNHRPHPSAASGGPANAVASRLVGRVERRSASDLQRRAVSYQFATDYYCPLECQMRRRYLTSARQRELESQLTERDLDVLQRVSDLRFVSGSQLARLCFADSPDQMASVRAARRALLRLVKLGTLGRLERPVGGVRAGSAGFVYHLGLAGQRLAVARGWQPERRARRSPRGRRRAVAPRGRSSRSRSESLALSASGRRRRVPRS